LNFRDRASFGQALVAQLPSLRRYAAGLAGSVAAADDLVQDCIERALRRADTLERADRLGAWLRSILHNAFLDDRRRLAGRGSRVDVDDLQNDLALVAPPEDRGEINDFVRAAMTLSTEHRQILLLVGVEGLSYRELADELGVPLGTVMSRLARARARLREALEQQPEGARR
jgi:RNA polymerase sigma-70 factor (ECF subfamily)